MKTKLIEMTKEEIEDGRATAKGILRGFSEKRMNILPPPPDSKQEETHASAPRLPHDLDELCAVADAADGVELALALALADSTDEQLEQTVRPGRKS